MGLKAGASRRQPRRAPFLFWHLGVTRAVPALSQPYRHLASQQRQPSRRQGVCGLIGSCTFRFRFDGAMLRALGQ